MSVIVIIYFPPYYDPAGLSIRELIKIGIKIELMASKGVLK